MELIFNNTVLTEDTLIKTDKHFADICKRCIDNVLSGKYKVNDKDGYIRSNECEIDIWLSGDNRTSFTYLQRAYWIQEGEMIALFA